MAGGGGVGKSSLTIRLITDNFLEEYDPTIEDDYRKNVTIDETVDGVSNKVALKLDILDTAGREEFSSFHTRYLKIANAFLIVYDITSRSSFEEVAIIRDKIIREREYYKIKDEFAIVICGNKCDLEEQRQVTKEEGKKLVQDWNNTDGCIKVAFYETSAKIKYNNEECFYEAARIYRRIERAKRLNKVTKKNEWDCKLL